MHIFHGMETSSNYDQIFIIPGVRVSNVVVAGFKSVHVHITLCSRKRAFLVLCLYSVWFCYVSQSF